MRRALRPLHAQAAPLGAVNGYTATSYDFADRVTSVKDHLSSSIDYVLDPNSNVIRTIEVEYLSSGGSSDTFYTEAYFDELDRQIATVTHLGNTRRALYDSRGNVIQVSDAMAGTGATELDDLRTAGEHGSFPQVSAFDPPATIAVNGRGNTTRLAYDGVSRLLSITRDLRSDGTGGTSVVDQIVTQQSWDANSRVASRTDPKGNVTTYLYDHQNRKISEVFADLTFTRSTFNKSGTVDTALDPRGVLQQFAYDKSERPTGVAYTNLPPGVEQTTFKAWRWDGLGRRSRAEDNDTINEFTFDSLSRLVEDKQRVSIGAARTSAVGGLNGEISSKISKRVFDGIGNALKKIYPSSTTFVQTFDAVDRLSTVSQSGTTLASFVHVGMGSRRASRTYPVPGIQQTLTYDADRKVVRLDAVKTSSSQRIRGFSYVWDREGNRRQERRLTVNTTLNEAGGPGEFFRYDSAYRLVHDDRDVASGSLDAVTHNAATVSTPTPDYTKAADYRLDAASSRLQTTIDGVTTAYDLSSDAQTRDLAMNQYTRIGATFQTHDLAGNTRSSSELGLQRFFDIDNRLVQWTQGSKDIRYRYDADGRRVVKYDAANSFAAVVYYWDGWQTVEETDTAGTVQKRYVWGEGIDEILRATLPDAADVDGDSNTTESVDLYYHQNSLGSVVAVTDAAGAVKESYRYSAFGTPTIFNAAGTQIASTAVKQPFLFNGARYDFEEGSGLHQMRHRYYDSTVGRFVSRDPLGLWGDSSQRGSGQAYCGHNPVNRTDRFGLDGFGGGQSTGGGAGRTWDVDPVGTTNGYPAPSGLGDTDLGESQPGVLDGFLRGIKDAAGEFVDLFAAIEALLASGFQLPTFTMADLQELAKGLLLSIVESMPWVMFFQLMVRIGEFVLECTEDLAEGAYKFGKALFELVAGKLGGKLVKPLLKWLAGLGTVLGGVRIKLKRPSGVSDEEWAAKLKGLNQAAAEGRARVVHHPERNGRAQRQAHAEGAIQEGHDADHELDLQFNGEDVRGNVKSRDRRVNRSVGAQGRQRMKYPDGTPIDGFDEIPPD